MFVALVIQHAKFMRRIILSSVACLAVLYISTLSHKWHDFPKQNKKNGFIETKSHVLILSLTFKWIFSYIKKNSAIYYYKYTYFFM
jgi:hypothetical protein